VAASFPFVLTTADLPKPGTSESATLEFKRTIERFHAHKLAKMVAGMANVAGGSILVGACHGGVGKEDILGEYRDVPDDERARAQNAVELANRDLCAPKPIVAFEPVRTHDAKTILSVSVYPFPGQAVGVRWKIPRNADTHPYVFYGRFTSHTTCIEAEQLPMLMVPAARRIAILLRAAQERCTVLTSYPQPPELTGAAKSFLVAEVDELSNTVRFESAGTSFWRGIDMIRSVHCAELNTGRVLFHSYP
jgi:hypothetical protein